MSTDIELLPLPRTLQHADDADLAAHVQDYARANVAHHTAKLQAEIEALRAEVATWEGLHASEVQVRQRWQARAERLAEALRDVMPFVVTDVLEHCDGNKCREQWCAGCSGDDEAAEAVARSAKAAGVAYALIHPTAAQENDDA